MDFSTLKNQILSDRNPYRTVGREQLEYIGGSFYKVDGVEMEVTPEVASDLDAFIGLSREQAKTVETASGETGIRNFRNYLASASSISKPMRLAIVGDRDTRRITKAVPLKDELITAKHSSILRRCSWTGTAILRARACQVLIPGLNSP